MKPRHLFMSLPGICGIALLLCCVNPFGGGGTETGSPGMTACAFAVYNEIESPRNWSPESYLPAGGMELDPGRGAQLPQRVAASKSGSALDTMNLVIIRHRTDTLITIDTLCIGRLQPDLEKRDSLRVIMRYPPAVTSIAQYRPRREASRGCFLSRTDTACIAKTDSFFIQLTQRPDAPVILRRDTVAGITMVYHAGVTLPQRLTVDSAAAVVAITAEFCLARQLPPPSGATTLPFMRQGDYTRLFHPAAFFGYATAATYSTPPSAATPQSRLDARFSSSRGITTALSVDFDAGCDGRFSSIDDNRIVRLDRERRGATHTLERIFYRDHYALGAGDSVELLFDKHQDTGLVKDAAIRYTCLPGNKAAGHRDHRIAGIHKALSFRDPVVQSVDLSIAFDTSGNARPFYDNARVTAKMYYGKGRTASFDGTLQAADNRLVGIYLENDVETPVEYARLSNILRWGND